MSKQWFILENEEDYKAAMERYQKVKNAPNGTSEHKEKMLLVTLIQQYEGSKWNLPELDPIELIKVRMEDFGYRSSHLAEVYGDKGTVSKVLNYKQSLSLTMIRKFSKVLRIPASALIREYELQS
jgi:HTH-type transcriptional regulator/antitoxin HigA